MRENTLRNTLKKEKYLAYYLLSCRQGRLYSYVNRIFVPEGIDIFPNSRTFIACIRVIALGGHPARN
jgi:hypothetical protein